jgi:hypothetical protein
MLDIAGVDPASHLADHDDRLAILLALAVKIHLDLLIIHGKYPGGGEHPTG